MIFPWLIPFLWQLAIGIGLTAVAAFLLPRPRQAKPEFRDLEYPTAEAGRPIPILFGTREIKGLNVIYYTEKNTRTYTVKA